MGLPIAAITTTLTVAQAKVEDKITTIQGFADPENQASKITVRYWSKEPFTTEKGKKLLVVGRPSTTGKYLSIDADLVTDCATGMNFTNVTVGGHMGAPRERNNPQAPQKFGLAISFKKDETSWFNINLWGDQPDFVQDRIVKGTAAVVTGTIDFRIYDDKYRMDVNTRRLHLLPKSQGQGGAPTQQTTSKQEAVGLADSGGVADWGTIPF